LDVLLAFDKVGHDSEEFFCGEPLDEGAELQQISEIYVDSQPGNVLAHAMHITSCKANPFTPTSTQMEHLHSLW
jgi:hypothetical protein